MLKIIQTLLIGALISVFPLTLLASQDSNTRQVGDYTIYYDVVPTSFLDPLVAQGYGITRSKGQGLLRITVLKQQDEDTPEPVRAMASGQAGNLAGQTRGLSFRQVEVGQADGYSTIAIFRYGHDEPVRFNIRVNYAPGQPAEELHFIRRLSMEQ